MTFKRCRFCYGSFIPTSKSQSFCSPGCLMAYNRFEAIRQNQEAEAASMRIVMEHRENGETMRICKGCCSVFFSDDKRDYCSKACEMLYGSNTAINRGKSANDAPSLHELRESEGKERAVQNRIKTRKRGIPAACKQSLKISKGWY